MKTVSSLALSQPIKHPKRNETSRNEPSLRALNADSGKRLRINDLTSIPAISPASSFVIGIRGSRTIRIERSPTRARIKEEATIKPAVQALDFKRIFDVLSLFIEIIAEENTIGTTRYRPKRTNKSVKKDITEVAATESAGRRTAVITPRAIPIKYLIQTFINFIISYSRM